MFRYVELFSGIGGFRTALDELGGQCVMASEIDSYAMKAYQALFGGAPELRGDVTEIDAEDVPDHDLLVGGFPCQSFSVAGHRRGFADTRGTLFFDIVRIASHKRPKLLLLENVKGLLNHDGGHTFDTMALVLNDIGYTIDFTVLNSKFYGVPQNRERVIIVASRDAPHENWEPVGTDVVAKTKRRIAELGVKTFNFDWPLNDCVTTRLRDVLETNVAANYYLSDEKTAVLLKQLGDRISQEPFIVHNVYGGFNESKPRIFEEEAPTIRTAAGGGHIPSVVEPYIIDDQGRTTRSLTPSDLAPSLRAQSHGNEPKLVEPFIIDPRQHIDARSGKGARVYWDTVPTINATEHKEPKLVAEIAVVNSYGTLIERQDDVSTAIDANYYKGLDNHGQRTHVLEQGCSLRTRAYCGQAQQLEVRTDGISNTVTSVTKDAMVLTPEAVPEWVPKPDDINLSLRGGGRNSFTAKHNHEYIAEEVRAVLTPDYVNKAQNGQRFKADGEPMFTLTTQDRHGVAMGAFQRYRIRKLTPLECWRLQSFTDEQHETVKNIGISDTQRYKMAGNAVTVNVIRAVGKQLKPLLE